MPWVSERRSASGSSIQPPQTKLVHWRIEKAMTRGKWYTRQQYVSRLAPTSGTSKG